MSLKKTSSRGSILRRPATIPDSSLSYAAAAVWTFLACSLSAAAVLRLTFGFFPRVCPASANPNRNVTQVIWPPINKADRGKTGSLDTGKKKRRKNLTTEKKKPSKNPAIFQANKSLAKANRFSAETKVESLKSKERHGTKR